MSRDRLASLACAAAMLALTFVWFWPALSLGLRNDDYLLVYYQDRTTGAVQWGRVFEEFVRPWFGTTELYRPLISLSFGLDLAFLPSPGGLHLTNVVSTGVTAAAIAATARRLLPPGSPIAWFGALTAGAVFVLHPATVEPTVWVAGRTTSLQLAFGAVGAWLFVCHLDGHQKRWPFLLAFALALGCKEGAVTLPLSLLALDLLHGQLHGRRRSVTQRLRLHAPALLLLAAYFAWRWLMLGRIGPADSSATLLDRGHNLLIRSAHLLAPPDPAGARGWWGLLWLLPLATLIRALGVRALLLPFWAVALLVPPTHMTADWQLMWGRLLTDAVPVLGIALSLALVRAPSRTAMLAAVAASITLLIGLATKSTGWLAEFTREHATTTALRAEVDRLGAAASPDRPLGLTGLPALPLYHQKLWGLLGMQPFAATDLAIVGLPEILLRDDDAPASFADAAPVHAIQASGGQVATWHAQRQQLVPMARAELGTVRLRSTATAPSELLVERPWPGTSLACLHITLPQPARRLRLTLLDDLPDERAFGARVIEGPVVDCWFDLTHAVAPLLLASFAVPFRGVRLEVDGGPPPAGIVAEVHGTLPLHEPPNPVAGRTFDLDALSAAIVPPLSPAPLTLYLLLPTGVRRMQLDPGRTFELAPELREHLRYAQRLVAPVAVHWFWQSADGQAQPWHTRLDHAVLR